MTLLYKTRKTPEKCEGCTYRQMLGTNQNDTACMYLLMTGHRRGCPVEECDKYEKRYENRRKVDLLFGHRKKAGKTERPDRESKSGTYYQKHRKELLAYQKRYYEEHRAEIRERQKAYRERKKKHD